MELAAAAGPSQLPPDILKPPPIPKKRRIRNAGITVLEEWAKNHPATDLPTHDQRKILLEKIHAVPGCEDFEVQNLTAWFQRRRKASRQSVKPSIQQSSLTKESIHHLETLFQAQQEFPSLKVIDTWAVLLKARREDVVAWLEAQRSSTGLDYASSPIHHLPTPVSTSPEPFPGVATHTNFESSLKSDPLHSPVVPSLFLKSGHLPHVQGLSRNDLIHAIVDATSNPSPSAIKLHTSTEFNDMFNSYTERINMIIRKNEEVLSRR